MRTLHKIICVCVISIVPLTQGCGKDTTGTGPQGEPGNPGINGVNSDPFYPIQLCSLCVARYPDTFPEVVFCYQGNLYDTYSANGGFSAPLPPGVYQSSGISCSCTVTIAAGCEVGQ